MYTLDQFPLQNKKGISIDRNSFEVNFNQRRSWFTDEEEQQLKAAGMISSFGFPHNYSTACCGSNNLFWSEEDLTSYLDSIG